MRFALAAVLLAALLSVPAAAAWTLPTDGLVLRPFLTGADPYAGGQHRGIDVAGPRGKLGACARRRNGLLRGHVARERDHDHDPDRRRLRRDAAPPRLDPGREGR